MNRRTFVKSAATAVAASTVYSMFSIGKAGKSANSKLNLAFIGTGNIAEQAYAGLPDENWVALCDVDASFISKVKSEFPQASGARVFEDFRVMFDKMGGEIDGVCVSTPDHTHFVASMWAIENNIHACTQKPLTRTIWEARALSRAAAEKGLITNMANQGHTYDGIRQAREWIEGDLIGQVTEVHSWEKGPEWGNGWFELPESYPPPTGEIPASLNWDLWNGPLAVSDYSPYFHPKTWRGFWEVGTGMLGDWFCHTCDGPVWILELFEPTSVELITKSGDNGPHIIPDRSVVKWHFEARNGKTACDLYWHDGGLKPSTPENWTFGELPRRGSFFKGTKNTLFLDERSNHPRLVNRNEMVQFAKSGYMPEVYERCPVDNPFAEWGLSLKGEWKQPGSSFDYAAKLTEIALLGVLAQRFGGLIEWDAQAGKIKNRPHLNQYLKEPVRAGWEIGQQYGA